MRHGCLEHHGEKKRGALVRTVSFAGSFESGQPDHGVALAVIGAARPKRRGAP
jgi:GTP cyclohydrolase I